MNASLQLSSQAMLLPQDFKQLDSALEHSSMQLAAATGLLFRSTAPAIRRHITLSRVITFLKVSISSRSPFRSTSITFFGAPGPQHCWKHAGPYLPQMLHPVRHNSYPPSQSVLQVVVLSQSCRQRLYLSKHIDWHVKSAFTGWLFNNAAPTSVKPNMDMRTIALL
jgi:hypothetical protein